MKISWNWLKEIYPVNISVEDADALLTACGLEVESVEEFESVKGSLRGLVVGEVMTCIKHPDADKLSLTTVDIGEVEPSQIVCGAPNVAAGQKVIVAKPGTTIYPLTGEPFTIKQAKIRGQVSNGMICAEDEIGLGISHAGVIVLPAESKVGTPASEIYNITSDHVLEIGLTPNRSDAASHIGVARDLASVIRTKKLLDEGHDEIQTLNIPSPPEPHATDKLPVDVRVEDTKGCPRYSGITISGVKVGESPAWLKNRLLSIGVNPINNIVDITNYVLHECGQPLHAFDVDKIKGKKIVVRTAKKDEKFITLDKVERKLHVEDLLICDESSPMCIAGVFGGIDSGITEPTQNVFIESAYFDQSYIRKTSKRHGLKTDASFRFERGTDPENTLYALKRASALICEISGGKIASPVTDIYPVPIHEAIVKLSYSYLNTFSGVNFEKKIVREILLSLGMKIMNEKDDQLEIKIPHYRVEVRRPADVIEEILRIYGYDRVPVPHKLNAPLPSVSQFDREKFTAKISSYLASNGFNETLTNSLTKSEYTTLPSWSAGQAVRILNPLSQELSIMRQSLLESALETALYNRNRKQSDLRIFEFGKIYNVYNDKYTEEYRLSILITGNRTEDSWNSKTKKSDFFQIKAFVNNILSLCKIERVSMKPGNSEDYGSSLKISSAGVNLGEMGIISKDLLKKFDITDEVFYAELNYDAMIVAARKTDTAYVEVSKFPAVKRDLSMLIGSEVTYSQLQTIAFNAERKLLKDIRLFDIYDGDKIEQGKKSYALTFILEDDNQTLTDKEINKVMDKLMAAYEREAGAVIRKN
jgi:phenylalanyl-tRNA synthetase beta chain